MSPYVSAEKFNSSFAPAAIVITLAAVIAMIFLSLTLLHILFVMAVPAYGRQMSNPQERHFIMSPLGLYFICLFISNLITSIGGIMEAGWIGTQTIVQGPTCTMQAFMLQLGSNATALWLAVISMSALRIFMFRTRSSSKFAALRMIVLFWVAMIIFDSVASIIFADRSNFFYGIAGLWCWITPIHPMARVFTQYFWMWTSSLVSAVCFLLVFLCMRGNIEVKRDEYGKRSINWSTHAYHTFPIGNGSEEYQGFVSTFGKTMCWFPITYITLIVPMSVSRVAETFGFPVPTYAFVFAAVNFLLIGVVNSIIYFALRRSLKRGCVPDSPDVTLRASLVSDIFGTDSFEIPREKRPPPISNPDPGPWTPTPTTKEWVPPSPHRGIDEATSPTSSVIAYAFTSGDDSTSAYRTSIVSNAPPRHVPVSSKLAQRSRSFHRPMESISTVTSAGTGMEHSSRLSPVSEAAPATELAAPRLTVPPAALIGRRQPSPSPNITSDAALDKLAPSSHNRSEPEGSALTGPRAISPDLKALLEATEPPYAPMGPPPPPLKTRRSPTPSVPINVDESDQGSFAVSPSPSIGEFDQSSPTVSIGDITTRLPAQHTDSMRTFWEAYEEHSARASSMPLPSDAAPLKRDTMRTFWAASGEPSPMTPNMPLPVDARSLRSMKRDSGEGSNNWRPSSKSSQKFRPVDSSVSLKPSISAVGRAPSSNDRVSPYSTRTNPAVAIRVLGEHRRSRSFTPKPTMPVHALTPGSSLRPAASAIARYGGPGLTLREGPSRNTPTPTPSDMNHAGDTNYRMPRTPPGYV